MYINFQQSWVSNLIKTVRTNIFAKNCKLHKFATIPIIFFKSITSNMHHYKMYMYINFQQNWVCIVYQSKPCTQIYLHKIVSWINLQLTLVILKKMDYFGQASS